MSRLNKKSGSQGTNRIHPTPTIIPTPYKQTVDSSDDGKYDEGTTHHQPFPRHDDEFLPQSPQNAQRHQLHPSHSPRITALSPYGGSPDQLSVSRNSYDAYELGQQYLPYVQRVQQPVLNPPIQQSAHVLSAAEYNETNPPPYIATLTKLSNSISNCSDPAPTIPIKKSFLMGLNSQYVYRNLSPIDGIALSQDFTSKFRQKDVDRFLTRTFFTRQTALRLFNQNSKQQRYNNCNHPRGNYDGKFNNGQLSCSLLGHTFIPGKFVRLNESMFTTKQPAPYYLHNRFFVTKFYDPIPNIDSESVTALSHRSPNYSDFNTAPLYSAQLNDLNSSSSANIGENTLPQAQICIDSNPQQILFRKLISASLCKEIKQFKKSTLKKTMRSNCVQLPLFIHKAHSSKSQQSCLIPHSSWSDRQWSCFSPKLLYDSKLSQTQRMSLLSKLFNATVSRVVLNSYIEYETSNQLLNQEHRISENHPSRYVEDDDGKDDYQHRSSLTQSQSLFTQTSKQQSVDIANSASAEALPISNFVHNYFNSTAIWKDYRIGLCIKNNPHFHQNLLGEFKMDTSTNYIPFALLLAVSKHNLRIIPTKPRLYLSLPLPYLLAMCKLDDPLGFPHKPVSTLPISDDINDSGTFNQKDADPELEFMKSHHIVDTVKSHRKRSVNGSLDQSKPQSDATWMTTASPLSLWILRTRKLQSECYSKSLRATHQREQYNKFFSIGNRYALKLYEYVQIIDNIYDIRLSPNDFAKDLKNAKGKLNHLDINDVFGWGNTGYRSTAKGLEDYAVISIYETFSTQLFSHHTCHFYRSGSDDDRHHNIDPSQQQRFHPYYTIPTPFVSSATLSSLSPPSSHPSHSRQRANRQLLTIMTHVPSSSAASSLANQLSPPPLSSTLSSSNVQHSAETQSINNTFTPSATSYSPHHRRRSSLESITDFLFGQSLHEKGNTLDHYLQHSKRFRYTTIYPNYPTSVAKYNNLGRCYSMVRAMVHHYISTHQIPRYLFNNQDYRLRPSVLLQEIIHTKSILTKSCPYWSKYWLHIRPHQQLQRRIIANSIAKGRYNPNYKPPALSRWAPNSIQLTLHNTIDGLNPDQYIYNHTISPQHQTTQRDEDDNNDTSGPEPQKQHSVDCNTGSFNDGTTCKPSDIPFDRTMLQAAKKKLRKVFTDVDIYSGDSIGQIHITGLFSLLYKTSWAYRGNVNLLLPVDQQNKSSFGKMFSSLFP